MIGTVRHRGLRSLIETGEVKLLRPDLVSRVRRLLSALQAADDLAVLETVPGWRLHPLKGEYMGYWSLSVSGNWRLVFRWSNGIANDLDLVDYH